MSSRELILGVTAFAVLAACGNVDAPREVECGTTPVEVLPNGSFDDENPAWVAEPATPSLLCGQPVLMPATLPFAACLGSVDGTTQTLTQTIPLPAGATNLTLTGQICIATVDTAAIDHDVLQFDLLVSGSVIGALGKKTNRDGVANCQFAAFELTGTTTSDPETAILRLRSTLDPDLPTTFYVDNLSLKVGCAR
jgi:hypothetical protein